MGLHVAAQSWNLYIEECVYLVTDNGRYSKWNISDLFWIFIGSSWVYIIWWQDMYRFCLSNNYPVCHAVKDLFFFHKQCDSIFFKFYLTNTNNAALEYRIHSSACIHDCTCNHVYIWFFKLFFGGWVGWAVAIGKCRASIRHKEQNVSMLKKIMFGNH